MDEKVDAAVEDFRRLLGVLKRLRGPDGCPWDRKQTVKTMAPLILEEAFEVTDAVEGGRAEKLSEELGDLSMNLLMTALISEEQGVFDLAEVFRKISRKLINRHPHVFGDAEVQEEEPFLERWEEIKKKERRESNEDASAVAGIPRSMPALLRALRLLEKMKRTGAALSILRSSWEDLNQEIQRNSSKEKLEAGVSEATAGKCLCLLAAACMQSRINPEMALRAYLTELEQRFRALEDVFSGDLSGATPEEINRIWSEGGREP